MENSYNWENCITLGPCSNRPAGDHEWSFKPNGGITEIKLRRGGVIVSITFKNIDEKGNIKTSNKFGGDAGCNEDVIPLNWPEEYLMKLSGTLVTYADFPGIESLCFETNLKKYGPFGSTDGTPFEFSMKDGVIVGFHGRLGIYVNTIGIYVKHSADLLRPSCQVRTVIPKVNSCNWENCITLGPCSNRPAGDHEWSFKPNGWITEIKLRRGGVLIESITFKSIDEKGNIQTSNKFGGDAGGTEHVISLNWPKEYLMKLSGTLVTYAEFPGIGSLCFETNLKKYGPFGHTDGTPFEFSVKDGVIAGFYGRFGIYVNNIGVYVKHSAELFRPSCQVLTVTPKDMSDNWNNSITIGPRGGEGGNKWSFKPNGGITEIKIGYVAVIDSISFKSFDENGMITSSEKFGGNVWKNEKIISLNWPKEYLMKISGTQRTYANVYCIESLSFHTNLNKYGPFGQPNGTPFELCMEDGVIVGFHGRSGVYINAIGVYAMNSADLFGPSSFGPSRQVQILPSSFGPSRQIQILPSSCGPSSQVQILTPQVNTGKMMNIDMPQELGPWGGNNTAKPWDDGVFLDINQVDVHVKNGILLGIQLRYQTKNGKSVDSERHGDKIGDVLYRIKLDSSSEYLIGIMGYYRPIEGNGGFEAVCSLSFYTNKGKYGPFGDQIGMFFSSPVTNGKIIGFHGRSGDYLDALGVHMEYS